MNQKVKDLSKLQHVGPNMEESAVQRAMMTLANTLIAQSSEMGALPTLYAATAPDVQGCDYIGSGGFMNMRGYPVKELSSDTSYDEAAASHLWAIPESLTGVSYEALQNLPQMVGQ